MSTRQRLQDYVQSLAAGDVFTTRHVIHLGSRSAVDRAIYRLIDKGEIVRVANGMFRLPGHDLPDLTPEEIALIKARAFCKNVIVHPALLAAELGLDEEVRQAMYGPLPSKFCVDGSTSTFRSSSGKIKMMRTSPRKMKLGSTRGGSALRLLWHIGKNNLADEMIKKVSNALGDAFQSAWRAFTALIPDWLRRRIGKCLKGSSPG